MTLNFDMTQVSRMFDQAEKVAATLPKEAYEVFRDETPYRSGNAYRNTRLRNNVIEANYAYAERLDDGYSRLKPRGMTEPTEKFLRKRINELIGKIK